MRHKIKIEGETAKREMTFSWQRKLLTDLVCALLGHQPMPGVGTDDVYCDRCWRWGAPESTTSDFELGRLYELSKQENADG